jgi:hypothetical protein
MFECLDALIGKTVNTLLKDCEGELLQFETDQGTIRYMTDADCCSESWINHISGIQALLGHKVLKTDAVEMGKIEEGNPLWSKRQDVDKIYSYKIFTSQGVCELELRNSSNGFYGGSLVLVTERSLEGYRQSPFELHELKPVLEDF